MEKEPFRIEIKEDKIIDILMHAATREDIQNLRNETNLMHAATREDIQNLRSEVNSKFERVETRFEKIETKFDDLRNEVSSKFDKVDAKFDKLNWLIIVGILIPILLHFMK